MNMEPLPKVARDWVRCAACGHEYWRLDTEANGLANDLCPVCRRRPHDRKAVAPKTKRFSNLNAHNKKRVGAAQHDAHPVPELPPMEDKPEPKICARLGCGVKIPQDMNFCSVQCERDYKELVQYMGEMAPPSVGKPLAVLAMEAANAPTLIKNPMLELMQRIVAERMMDVHHVLQGSKVWTKEQVTLFKIVLQSVMDPKWAAIERLTKRTPEERKREDTMEQVEDLSTSELEQMLRLVKSKEVGSGTSAEESPGTEAPGRDRVRHEPDRVRGRSPQLVIEDDPAGEEARGVAGSDRGDDLDGG